MDTQNENEKEDSFVEKYAGGPLGLGDPNRKDMRIVEKQVLIPKLMREKAWREKCKPFARDFSNCAIKTGLLSIVMCRSENRELQDCLLAAFTDEKFRQECTELYLSQREEYRRTGVSPVEQYKIPGKK